MFDGLSCSFISVIRLMLAIHLHELMSKCNAIDGSRIHL